MPVGECSLARRASSKARTPEVPRALPVGIYLGGGVVEAVFADCTPSQITGTWRSSYAPFTVSSPSGTPGSMGAVHQPFHPIMSGVSAISMGSFRTGNNNSSLRSPNCVYLAEYTDAGLCLAACFDSAGRRAASLGMFPLTYWQSSASGQWCRLIVNALDWAAVGPSVGVTVPNGGETWHADSVYNIMWTQTDNGVKDSIYYSTNGGLSWTGLVFFATPPAPLQYAWNVPAAPTTRARVKVVTWNENGGRVEDMSNANFTIAPSGGIEEPEDDALPPVFALRQPSPNPAVFGALICYDLPRTSPARLQVYDVTGTLVRRLVDGHSRPDTAACTGTGSTTRAAVSRREYTTAGSKLVITCCAEVGRAAVADRRQ